MKYILITGVSSGIGRGMANSLINEGYHVIGSVRSKKTGLELSDCLGKQFSPLVFDINNENDVEKASEEIAGILNDNFLTAIINNAGFAEIGPLLQVSIDNMRLHLDTLVVGQLLVIQHFYKYLIPSQSKLLPGRIINISSVSGKVANPYFGCYCAGKHALEGLSKSLRKEMELFGIKVVVVAPGNIATDIWSKQTLDVVEKYKDTVYYQRLLKSIKHINNNIKRQAMTVEEFVGAFMQIITVNSPAERYTIIKSKRRWLPFIGEKVRTIKK